MERAESRGGSKTSTSAQRVEEDPLESPNSRLLKVVFVGDSGVGKTCLINRLFADSFNDQLPATIGVEFRFKRFTVDGVHVGVTLWDTAGAEKFRAITSNYYRGAHGFVLVYDVTRRETFDSLARHWLPEVARYSSYPDALRLIIGNKIDLESAPPPPASNNKEDPDLSRISSSSLQNSPFFPASRRAVSVEEAAEFARDHGCLYHETSAKTDQNVYDALVWGLVVSILDTPSLLRAVPIQQRRLELEGEAGEQRGRRRGCCG